MYALPTVYSKDHVPGRDPPLLIPVGAYFHTNLLYSTAIKCIC